MMTNPDRNKLATAISCKHCAPALAALMMTVSTTAWPDASPDKAIAPLKPDVPYVFVVHQGRSIKVERDIYKSFISGMDIRGMLIQTSGSCPPFCLQPIKLDIPVDTVGEREIVDFMLTTMRDNKGKLIDVRSKTTHANGAIPGSDNIYIRRFNQPKDSEAFRAMLKSFGAEPREPAGWFDNLLATLGIRDNSMMTDHWDFTNAKTLVLWATSATDSTAADAARILYEAGYPAEKLKWYRGGLAAWQYWGFTTVSSNKRK